jgi:hypothetical protein
MNLDLPEEKRWPTAGWHESTDNRWMANAASYREPDNPVERWAAPGDVAPRRAD